MSKDLFTHVGGEIPTNAAEQTIIEGAPYTVAVTLKGSTDLLFHRWNVEAVEEKAKAAKGSKTKKEDNIESYVYRTDKGEIALPGEYFRQSIIHAAKFKQDPRSPRKSAMDLYKSGLISLTPLASLGKDTWDYLDKRRVVVQRNGVTRVRPAMLQGWEANFNLMVILPEYIKPADLHEVINNAGRFVGVADYRPTYGRFQIVNFDLGFE